MLGKRCKGYFLSTGTRASWGTQDTTTGRYEATSAPASLTEIPSIKSVTIPSERSTATSKDRGADWEAGDTGPMTGGVQIQLNHRATDAGRDALEAAYFLDDPIALALLDKASDVVGAKGLWADYKVSKFARNEPEDGPVVYDVELIPYDQAAVDPEWVELTAA